MTWKLIPDVDTCFLRNAVLCHVLHVPFEIAKQKKKEQILHQINLQLDFPILNITVRAEIRAGLFSQLLPKKCTVQGSYLSCGNLYFAFALELYFGFMNSDSKRIKSLQPHCYLFFMAQHKKATIAAMIRGKRYISSINQLTNITPCTQKYAVNIWDIFVIFQQEQLIKLPWQEHYNCDQMCNCRCIYARIDKKIKS